MSMTAVPISIRLVRPRSRRQQAERRRQLAVRNDARRTNATVDRRRVLGRLGQLDGLQQRVRRRCGSCEPGAARQCPNDRKPILMCSRYDCRRPAAV
jgi:hypothetical protein